MNEKKRILLLALIMAVACFVVVGITSIMLYRAAFDKQTEVLVSAAQSQARLIESMAKFDDALGRNDSGGSQHATLDQIIEAHRNFKGIGQTGEYTLAKREGERIVFLLSHRFYDFDTPKPVPMNSNLAEPMRLALSGRSGTIVGLDYRGERVLAAYEPVAGMDMGIVAKIDLAEIRAPFVKAGSTAVGLSVAVILGGVWLFLYVTNPILNRLQENARRLMDLVTSLQQSEKNLHEARDELETRVEERTAELSAANEKLQIEVHEHGLAEQRLRAMWKAAKMTNAEMTELTDQILQGTMQMTQSEYAFYGFLDPDESVMSVYSWSHDALEKCRILKPPVDFPIAGGGIWADAVRKRKSFFVNDYNADNPGKKGLPKGHVPLTRILVVPVFSHGKIVAVAAAANKATPYTDEDLAQLEAFASGIQVLIDRKRTEEELRRSEMERRILSRKVLEAEEEERKRLAREIHDGLGQSLAAIKFRVEGAYLSAKEEAVADAEELKFITEMIQDTMEEMHTIHNDLHPAYIEELGILKALTYFCSEYENTYPGIHVESEINLSEEEVPDYLKVPIYRISQEAMNNAAKHSKASRLRCCLQKTDRTLRLSVEDNGVGFALGDGIIVNANSKGLGLHSMKERAELTGGSLTVKSAPDNGTLIKATWQLGDTPDMQA